MEEFNGVAGGMEEASYKLRNIRYTRKRMNNLVQFNRQQVVKDSST